MPSVTGKSVAKKVAYSAAELITLGRGIKRNISGVEIRLPPKFSRYYQPDYEKHTVDFINQNCKPGDTVFDLGAHLGLLSVAMARCVAPAGRVIAFEPSPFTNKLLKKIVRINHLQKVVEVRAEAVSGSSGSATFHFTTDEASNANSLMTEAGPDEVRVKTIKLDDFAESRTLSPSVIKIDVEGAELQVLKGAARIIQQFRPALWLALHPVALRTSGTSLQNIWELLNDFKMTAYASERDPEELASEQWFCSQTALFDVELQPHERRKPRTHLANKA
jgi:FkbM family methyltransferase